MQKQISFVLTAAILMIAFVGAVLYTVEATNAQGNMTAGGNMSKGGNMTAGGNMTNATSGAKPNATD
jgi:hypothetical protein